MSNLFKSQGWQTTIHGPNLAHYLSLQIKFYWYTAIPIHLWITVDGCFLSTASGMSYRDRDDELKIFIILSGPLQENMPTPILSAANLRRGYSVIIIPILQVRKLRHRKTKKVVQSHTCRKWRNHIYSSVCYKTHVLQSMIYCLLSQIQGDFITTVRSAVKGRVCSTSLRCEAEARIWRVREGWLGGNGTYSRCKE